MSKSSPADPFKWYATQHEGVEIGEAEMVEGGVLVRTRLTLHGAEVVPMDPHRHGTAEWANAMMDVADRFVASVASELGKVAK
jgi:hypothetical protein